MAKLYNLARMTTSTTGAGTITLGAAASGYLTFAQAGVSNAEVVSYGIKDGSNSEVGTGTYTSSGTTLTRTVTSSTNSNAAINLSGSAEVYITARAEDLLSVTESRTANTVLAAPNGSNGAPSFRAMVGADLPSGPWVLLNTLTASSSANLADTTSFTSTYKDYQLVLEHVLPATNSVNMLLQVNSGGVQSSSYLSGLFAVTSSAGTGANSSTSAILLNFSALSNTGDGMSGDVTAFDPLSTGGPKRWILRTGYLRADGFTDYTFGGGTWNGGNGAITGFQLSASSGNIASGVVKVYGRK